MVLNNVLAVARRRKVLEWLSSKDHETKHDEVRVQRKENTGEWFVKQKDSKAGIITRHIGYGVKGNVRYLHSVL